MCRRCIQKSTGRAFAVKIVSRRLDCQQEINLLRACQGHSNIVTFHEVFYDEVSIINIVVIIAVFVFRIILSICLMK